MALKAVDVRFSYDGKEAVAGVSLSVASGEYVTLIGPNGAGKTTLLRLLSGALAPRRGKVLMFGRDLHSVTRLETARRIAVVPQESSIVFPFTVEEVVLMGRFPHLAPYGFEGKHDLDVAHEAMRLTGTEEFAVRPVQELSGGERQRVIVARALAQEPEILLLDEPTAFLDIAHQVEVCGLVQRLRAHKRLTVVATSHDLNLASAASDRLILLKEGRVFAQGTPDEVIDETILAEAYGTPVDVAELKGRRFVVPQIVK